MRSDTCTSLAAGCPRSVTTPITPQASSRGARRRPARTRAGEAKGASAAVRAGSTPSAAYWPLPLNVAVDGRLGGDADLAALSPADETLAWPSCRWIGCFASHTEPGSVADFHATVWMSGAAASVAAQTLDATRAARPRTTERRFTPGCSQAPRLPCVKPDDPRTSLHRARDASVCGFVYREGWRYEVPRPQRGGVALVPAVPPPLPTGVEASTAPRGEHRGRPSRPEMFCSRVRGDRSPCARDSRIRRRGRASPRIGLGAPSASLLPEREWTR